VHGARRRVEKKGTLRPHAVGIHCDGLKRSGSSAMSCCRCRGPGPGPGPAGEGRDVEMSRDCTGTLLQAAGGITIGSDV
jgi:hypothetical protein